MRNKEKYSIEEMIFSFQKQGKITFSNEELKKYFPDNTARLLELTANKLITQKKIVSVWKGFYVIIPVKYLLNMEQKIEDTEFLGDIEMLLRPNENYNPQEAWKLVKKTMNR